MDDQQIIALYWARSEQAITETTAKYGGYCLEIAFRVLSAWEEAEECVNDTWLRAWNAMPPHRPACLHTFLGKITRNLALDRWKHANAQKRRSGQPALALAELETCIPSPETVEGTLDAQALTESLNRFLAGLPRKKRILFIQRYWYLCSVKDIAARFGMREGTVASTLSRLRRQLRIHLEREGFSL